MDQEQAKVRIRRARRSADELKKYSNAFRTNLSAQLKERHKALLPQVDLGTQASVGALLKPEDRDRYVRNWQDQATVTRVPTLFNVTIAPGDQVIGLPFDDEWSEGSGNIGSLTAKDDGELLTMNTDGYSVSGVGVFLDTNTHVAAAATAIGSHSFNWSSWTNNANVRSSGGAGVAVTDENGELYRHESTLWNIAGAAQFTGTQWSGALETEVSSSSPFGPIMLQPLLFDMHPGKTYGFWIWVWQVFQSGGDNGFLAFNSGKVNMIRVSAGPPIHVA